MSGIFRTGQLVASETWVDSEIELYSEPGVLAMVYDDPVQVLGVLRPDDVALVIAVPKSDGSSVYILGPSGGGWAFGAMLRVVTEV